MLMHDARANKHSCFTWLSVHPHISTPIKVLCTIVPCYVGKAPPFHTYPKKKFVYVRMCCAARLCSLAVGLQCKDGVVLGVEKILVRCWRPLRIVALNRFLYVWFHTF